MELKVIDQLEPLVQSQAPTLETRVSNPGMETPNRRQVVQPSQLMSSTATRDIYQPRLRAA